MVSAEKNAPTEWDVEAKTNIKWVAKLGSKAYGNPIVTNGMVIVGTNNEAAYDKKYTNPDGSAIDGGVLMAFDEKTGKFLWQKYFAKLAAGRVNDWPGEGICSTVYARRTGSGSARTGARSSASTSPRPSRGRCGRPT
jgi:outer membrane protein assembly factor BamB